MKAQSDQEAVLTHLHTVSATHIFTPRAGSRSFLGRTGMAPGHFSTHVPHIVPTTGAEIKANSVQAFGEGL